jgi:hypothetical protein
MRENESCCQCHSRTALARRGVRFSSLAPFYCRPFRQIDHPFVVNLRYAFQDDENCFFVLDLMLGGDLRFHLDRLTHLPEETVRFHMAELSSALCFLHEKHIMHRFALSSLAPALVHSCPAALTEILSRTISYLMSAAMPTSLILTSPSIIPSVGCSPA